jgi:hydrogenase expression/formation protein HypC
MCLSIPLQVVEWDDAAGAFAWVERGAGASRRRERLNMMLIGPQPVGTWVLGQLGLARETIDDAARALIEDALRALDAALAGDYDPSRHFADLERKTQ